MRRTVFSLFVFSALSWAQAEEVETNVTTGRPLMESLNLRTNVPYLAYGNWNATLEVPVVENLTIAPTVLFVKSSRTSSTTLENIPVPDGKIVLDDTETGLRNWNVGLELNWYLSGWRNDSIVISPAVYWARFQVDERNLTGTYSGSVSGFAFALQASRHWFWENGMNFRCGGGAMLTRPTTIRLVSNDKRRIETDVPSLFGNGINLTLEASLGYAF